MKKWLRWLIAAIILVGLVIWSVNRFYINKPHTDYSKAKPDFSMTATNLYNDFKTDRTTSSTRYNGKVIEFSGQLTKIEATDTSAIAVFVFNQGMFGDEGIRCIFLPEFNDRAKKFTAGSQVKVKGFCTGATDSDIIIEKGSIVE
jgi:hypothetical protein